MIQATLFGTLVGRIWWPTGAVCTKPVRVDLTAERRRLHPTRAGSLRHMLTRIVADGDFRECGFSPDTEIVLQSTRRARNGIVTRSRAYSLSDFEAGHDLMCSDEDAEMVNDVVFEGD